MGGVRSSLRLGSWILALSSLSVACGRTAKNDGHPSKPDTTDGGAAAVLPSEPAPNCAVTIAGNGRRHCAAYQDGSVWCWGTEGPGPANFVASSEPRQVEGLTGVQRLVLGPRHSCAQGSDGLSCWGDNESAQIDDSGTTPLAPTSPQLSGPEPRAVTGFGLSETQTCSVNVAAHVYCRGTDATGVKASTRQVNAGGAHDTTIPGSGPEVIDDKGRIIGLGDFSAPAPLDFYGADNAWFGAGTPVCVLKRWGSLWCGAYDLDTKDHLLHAKLALGENVVQAGVGDLSLCALTKFGSVWCEGLNQVGEAGNGSNSVFADGGFVIGADDVRVLSVNDYSTCVVPGDGSVWCWGAYAQERQSNLPTRVSGCEQQTTEPPIPRGFVSAPLDRAQHLAEASRARAQATCACQGLGEPDENCINGADLSPNPACLDALAQDRSQSWDCRAYSDWEEVTCYSPEACANSRGELPPCPPPPPCDAGSPPPIENYCRRQTCAADQEQPLTRAQICDGVPDCTDGSDERNCAPGTPFFECDKGSIVLQRVCDGVPDCTDGSDEQYCD